MTGLGHSATGRVKLQVQPCPQCPVSDGRPEKGGLSLRAKNGIGRLVCRESSIVRGDGARFTTPLPSRLEARSRLGFHTANELGAPVVSSVPEQLPGH